MSEIDDRVAGLEALVQHLIHTQIEFMEWVKAEFTFQRSLMASTEIDISELEE